MILHFAKENDFKVSLTCLPQQMPSGKHLGSCRLPDSGFSLFLSRAVVEAGSHSVAQVC